MGEAKMEILLTCALGVGTVFVGLICIILLVEIMHRVVAKAADSSHSANTSATVEPVAVAPQRAVIANRGEVIAAISSAIAEELGKDVKAIRITSIKKI